MKILEEILGKLSDVVSYMIGHLILDHIAIAVLCGCRSYHINNIATTCGCGSYRISNIVAPIVVADYNLKPRVL